MCVCVSMTDERLSVEREIVWAADGVCAWWFADCVHIYISSEWSNKKKLVWLTHLASHWNELESSDSQLQTAACPLLGHKGLCYHRTHKQSLDVLLEWIAVVCITQLIKAERFKRRAEFFIPWYVLIALHCISCHRWWGRRQRSWGKLRRWAGGVSGTGLINVNITGRLISLHVSSPFLTKEEMEPDSLSLNLAFSGYPRVSAELVCVCACVSDIVAPAYVPIFSVQFYLCQYKCTNLALYVFPSESGIINHTVLSGLHAVHQNMPLGHSIYFIRFDN